jgi:SAM-dependent methyltransferase
LLPKLKSKYAAIVIALIPGDDKQTMDLIASKTFSSDTTIKVYLNDDRRNGRILAIEKAMDTDLDFIHYTDMDRLLHWVETQPAEWSRMVDAIQKYDCVIFGRTQDAFSSHPQALITTEIISNQVVSHFLNEDMDVSAGSKSFSRIAAQYILEHCHRGNSFVTDAEWPISLKQAGYKLHYIQVDGLDWESADQYQDQAASRTMQSKAAAEYDADPKHWKRRIEIAEEIIRTALEISRSKYPEENIMPKSDTDFDFDAVFEVDDYLYFYQDELTDERSDKEVTALVSLLKLDQPKKILDLACGFGRHSNRLALLGHQMTGIDITAGFLEIAKTDSVQKGVDVHYQLGDMRKLAFSDEFDVVLLLFTAFGYFSEVENLQVLVNARNALLPGGTLIFDIQNRDAFLKGMRPYYVVEKEGNVMIDRMSFDSLLGRSYNKRIVYRDGIRKDKPFSVRLYNPNEIQVLIVQAGMELLHIYGSWNAEPLTSESNRMIVIARKPV